MNRFILSILAISFPLQLLGQMFPLSDHYVYEAVGISEMVDAILLDSGNPKLKIKELGGTGRVHNWKFSRQIRDQSKCPVFLAGGLNPENVRQAIEEVMPFAVDVCSGVRTDGKLDSQKLELFIIRALEN